MTTENQTSEEPKDDASAAPANQATPNPEPAPPPVAPAKKRGRPSNADKAARESGASTVEQIEKGAATGGSTKPRKASNTKRVTKDDLSSLAKQLVGLHQLGAMLSGIPEIAIAEPEGAALATGIIAVCEEYDLSINGKTGAALQLLGACAMVYTPRVFQFNSRMQKARAAAKAAQDANTVDVSSVVIPDGPGPFAPH